MPLAVKFDLLQSTNERTNKLTEFKHTFMIVRETKEYASESETIVYIENKKFLCPRSIDVKNLLKEELNEILKYPGIKGISFELNLLESNNHEMDFCYCEICSK